MEDWPGWSWERLLPPFDREQVLAVDDIVPVAEWFWGHLGTYCVVECCGIDAFDFRASYVAWMMRLTERKPAEVKGLSGYPRVDDGPNLASLRAELIGELTASASLLDELSDPVVVTHRLGTFARPGELADLFRHLAAALNQSAPVPPDELPKSSP